MTIPIDIKSQSLKYNIHIGELPNINIDSNVAIITNETVSKLHIKELLSKINAKRIKIITTPDGEKYKNLETIENILNQLFEEEFNRDSVMIAFGGGVIGDMTGFASSLYQRGIEFIQIPTTLLSQVDASVGGKTGINNKYGKNLIGTFHQPSAVYIDPSFLKTLPKREFSAGMAEVIKMAVIFDKDFFNSLDKIELKDLITKSIQIKSEVIEKDEKELGIRAVLNYGHTFGHVIENETNYEKYIHGEAVSIGINMVNDLAVELGLLTIEEKGKIESKLINYNLPITYKIKDINSFYEKLFLDKKTKEGQIKFILPNGIGNYEIVSNIKENIIKKILSKYT